MLAAFEGQDRSGGPITVTHPEVTRYFMTIEEAVQLVIEAGAIGRDGAALVLDMGEPVRIADVARLIAARADHHIDIEFTGLRKGEKLHETLVGKDETPIVATHPLVSQVAVPPLHPDAVLGLDDCADPPGLIQSLRNACGSPPPIDTDTAAELTLNSNSLGRLNGGSPSGLNGISASSTNGGSPRVAADEGHRYQGSRRTT
jgi:hypothetical protein